MDYRGYRKILRMVSELHVRGFQRIRIAPGMSASGCHWRCAVAPAINISRKHGARLVGSEVLVARYTSGQGRKYFDWTDAAHATPSRMADLFIERFPEIAEAGKGSDWIYAGWYLEMLHLTYPDSFPIAYADYDLPEDYLPTVGPNSGLRIPFPPPGLGEEEQDIR